MAGGVCWARHKCSCGMQKLKTVLPQTSPRAVSGCRAPVPGTDALGREALPKRRVEPLNVRRIHHTVPVQLMSEGLHTCRRAIDHAVFSRDHTAPLIALDDWAMRYCATDVGVVVHPGPCARDREKFSAWPGRRTLNYGTDEQGRRAAQRLTRSDQPLDQGHITWALTYWRTTSAS